MAKITSLSARLISTLFPAILICAGTAAAAPIAPFNGRWRIDTNSFKGNIKPTIIKLDGHGFQKDDNEPTTADGKFHPVKSDGYVDEQSVSIASKSIIKEVDRLHGKTVYTVDYIASSDGSRLETQITSFANPSSQPVRSSVVYHRSGEQKANDNLVTGKWERTSVTVDQKNDWVIKLSGNRFSRRTEGGVGYDAVIGGGSVKKDGDNSGSRVLISRPNINTIIETGVSSKGKWEDELSLQLSSDHNTIHARAVYAERKTWTTFNLQRVEN